MDYKPIHTFLKLEDASLIWGSLLYSRITLTKYLLTRRMANTTLDRPDCTATVLMVVVDGGNSVKSVQSDNLSDILICYVWSASLMLNSGTFKTHKFLDHKRGHKHKWICMQRALDWALNSSNFLLQLSLGSPLTIPKNGLV